MRPTTHLATRHLATRSLLVAAAAALVLAACGGTADPEQPPEGTVIEAPEADPQETATEEPETESEDDPEADAGAAEPGREGTDPVPEDELPGNDFALYFSEQGAVADVVGVRDTDVLFALALPDYLAEEVGRFEPTDEVVLAGRERSDGDDLWAEVELADGVGWVESRYLGYLAEPGEDVTSEFTGYGGRSDASAVLTEIVEDRVEEHTEGSEAPRWELIQAQVDTAVFWVDILPFFDDAVYGERLEIHIEEAADGAEVTQVQRTLICSRGASEGLCV